MRNPLRFSISGLDPYEREIRQALGDTERSAVISRIWKKDHTLWKEKDEEISNRLGWLSAPDKAPETLPELESFVREIREEGYSHALLLGMGGSSLAPEVFSRIFGTADGYLKLGILDSTDPEVVLSYAEMFPLEKALYLVSSKSGMTLETTSFLNFFYARACERLGNKRGGAHFAAITDPGTPLEKAAHDLLFRRVFAGDPEIGGRFSVLSPFGLVPAALIGMNAAGLVDQSRQAARLCQNPSASENPGVYLGVLLGTLALAGRDKVAFLLSPEIESFGAWIEQLLAESTGKEGRGILPIVRDPDIPAGKEGQDRIFVHIGITGDKTHTEAMRRLAKSQVPLFSFTLNNAYELGGHFFLWEMATAVAGHFLKVNPFDQPDVAASKKRTEAVLKTYKERGSLPEENGEDEEGLKRFLSLARPGDYIALLAFLPPLPGIASALKEFAAALRARTGLAVTYDFGPRFLHSTGQLHKGGRGNGLFIQLTADHFKDTPVPAAPASLSSLYSFGVLENAQACGDREALREKGRRLIHFHFRKEVEKGIGQLISLI